MDPKQFEPELTPKQRFWLAHLQACADEGESMSAYAARHELSLKQFYNWKWRLGQKGLWKTDEPRHPGQIFQAVRIVDSAPIDSSYRIGFPNGLWIEVTGRADYSGLLSLLSLIKGLQ